MDRLLLGDDLADGLAKAATHFWELRNDAVSAFRKRQRVDHQLSDIGLAGVELGSILIGSQDGLAVNGVNIRKSSYMQKYECMKECI